MVYPPVGDQLFPTVADPACVFVELFMEERLEKNKALRVLQGPLNMTPADTASVTLHWLETSGGAERKSSVQSLRSSPWTILIERSLVAHRIYRMYRFSYLPNHMEEKWTFQ